MSDISSTLYKLLYDIGILHNKIQVGLCFIALLLMIIPFPLPVAFYGILFTVGLIAFVCLKDLCDNAFVWVRIMITVYAVAIVERGLKSIEYYHNFDIITPVKLMVYITVIVFALALLFTDNKKKENYWKDVSLLKNFNRNVQLVTRDENGNDTYDIAVCLDENQKNPIIWQGESRFVHSMILGPTGTGKTGTLFLPLIVQDIKNNRGVIVVDPKSDLAVKAYCCACINGRQDAQYFDPIAPNCPYYNVLYGDETDVTETIVTTFLTMETSNTASPYWGNVTENLLRKACMVVKRIEAAYEDPETGISSRPATLLVLNDLIQNVNGRGRDMVNELTNLPASPEAQRENIDTKDWFITSYFVEQSKAWQDASNIRMSISRLCQNKYLKKVLNPPDGVSQVDFASILAEGKFLSISLAQGKLGALAKVLSSFLILTMERAVLNRPGDEWSRIPSFLYIDEAQVVINKGFNEILEQGRSYRISANLATQTLNELKKGQDGDTFLSSVQANTRNKFLLAGLEYDDAKVFEERFGKKKDWVESYSESHQKFTFLSGQPLGNPTEGTKIQEMELPYMTADEIAYKPFGTLTVQLVEDKSLQRPVQGKANFLNKDENHRITMVVDEYNRRNQEIITEEETREREERRARNRKWQINKRGGTFAGTIQGVDNAIKGKSSIQTGGKITTQITDGNPFGATAQPKGKPVQPIKPEPAKPNFFDVNNEDAFLDDEEM